MNDVLDIQMALGNKKRFPTPDLGDGIEWVRILSENTPNREIEIIEEILIDEGVDKLRENEACQG